MIDEPISKHAEKDKIGAPFLLACSYNQLIDFHGSQIRDGVVHWIFSPTEEATALLEQLGAKTEPRLPAKDLFDAIEMFWKQVAKTRNEQLKNEGMDYATSHP